jgi:phage protein U
MITGMLGDVTFEVSSETYRTIKNLSRSNKANFATHKLVAKKGIIEFTGSEPETITFEAMFSAWFGENPETWRKKLTDLMEKGKSMVFVLGTWPLRNRWVIESLTFNTEFFYKDGTPGEYKASISLKEDP